MHPIYTKDKFGKTLLHHVAKAGYVEAITLLINKGLDVNAETSLKLVPLYCACMTSNNEKTIELLLNNGANIDAQNKTGHTPLHLAVSINY